MKAHSADFKEEIKQLGKQQEVQITFGNTTLTSEYFNSVTPSYEGGLLKSVMKQLEIDSNIEIPVGTEIRLKYGLLINGDYEYIDYGKYIVKEVERQEDTRSYLITCYDKLLYSMKDYESFNTTYPITIREYITKLCNKLGLTFANASQSFVNYNKQITSELYLDSNGNNIGYTFRDVLDELAQVTASTICINANDQLEIRYIKETNDTINEQYLKDINVNFGKKYGKINSIVLSRAGESDNIYLRDEDSVKENGLCELKISDNQIMNFNTRDEFLPEILDKLNGTEYYLNDFTSTGIMYYDLCDRYTVQIGEITYSCVMFNDDCNITQGLEEIIYTEEPETSETDYTKADKTDRKINKTYIIVDKQNQEIDMVVSNVNNITNTKGEAEGKNIHIEDSAEEPFVDISLHGESTQNGTPTPDNPSEIENLEVRNKFDYESAINVENLTYDNTYAFFEIKNIKPNTAYTISNLKLTDLTNLGYSVYAGLTIGNTYSTGPGRALYSCISNNVYKNGTGVVTGYSGTKANGGKLYFCIATTNTNKNLAYERFIELCTQVFENAQIEEGTVATPYVPYNSLEFKVTNGLEETDENYQEQVAYFPLSEEEKLMEGSYLADDGIHHTRKQVEIDVTQIRAVTSYNNIDYASIPKPADFIGYNSCIYYEILCNKAISQKITSWDNAENINKISSQPEKTKFYLGFEKGTTLEQMKTALANTVIEYDLAEPEVVPYTAEQQVAWNKIKALMTYKNITNITSDAYAKVVYMRDNGLDVYETKQSAKVVKEQLAEQKITVDKILDRVSRIEDLTQSTSGIKTIVVSNCAKGDLLSLRIKGNNEVFKHLYPNDTLYPSDTLYPYGDSRISVIDKDNNETIYELGITEVLRQNGKIYDEYILEGGQATVFRRINADGTIKASETIENLGTFNIPLNEGTNTIKILNYTAEITAKYAIKNDYTDIFATKVEMNSSIEQTAERINQVVRKKVDEDEIISRINQSAEKIAINADKIDIAGKAVNFQTQINETIGPFTKEDRDRLIKIIMEEITPTVEDYEKLDVNKDGKLDSFDMLIITKAINNGGYYNLKGTFYINPYSGVRTLSLYNDMSKNYTAILSLFDSTFSKIKTRDINLTPTENDSCQATTRIFPNSYQSYLTDDDSIKYKIGFMGNGDNSEHFPYMDFSNGEHKINIFNGATDDMTYIELLYDTVATKIKASGITTPTLVQTSLETEKKNFEKLTLEEAKKILEKTDIYKYNLKSQDDSKKKHIGFVIGKNFNYAEEITSENNDGANIYSMTSVLYTVVQEQQKQINQLQEKIEKLEGGQDK